MLKRKKYRTHFLLTIAFSVHFLNSYTQIAVSTKLSKQEMLEDYNYLLKTIVEVNPEIEPLSQVIGYDIMQQLQMLKMRLDSITNDTAFVNDLIIPAFKLCRNQHINLVSPFEVKEMLPLFQRFDTALFKVTLKFIDTACFNVSSKYFYMQKRKQFTYFFRGTEYIDGAYYIAYPFKYKGKKYNPGAQILKVNNELPNDLVNQYCTFERNNTKYDIINRANYNASFYAIDKWQHTPITFTIKTPKGEVIDVNTKDKSFKYKAVQMMMELEKVKLFRNRNILYIRLPEMTNDTEKLQKKIIKKAKGKTLEKVIIDIRRNPGGNDLCWMNVLRTIIDTTFICRSTIIAKNTSIANSYLTEKPDEINIPFLSNENFYLLHHDSDSLVPFSNSIDFKKQIYLIQDRIYSSAMSFSDYANHHPRITSVGVSAGYIGGLGITPRLFMLPNSKLMFFMVADLSVAEAKNCEELFQSVEIPVTPTINDAFYARKLRGKLLGKHYLKRKDSFFRAVMER